MSAAAHPRRRIAPGILRRLRRVGIDIAPFLVVREPERADVDRSPAGGLTLGFVDASAVPELVRLEPENDPAQLGSWFDQGRLCFAVMDGDRMLAKMWCDLREFNYPPNRRALEADEAYLFAAFADPAVRGRNLAPVMRAACYDALRELGRTRFWSYSEYFNRPARRFKQKLGAQEVALRLHVGIAGGRGGTVTLRRRA